MYVYVVAGEHLFPLINAAVDNGADACFLSGSGEITFFSNLYKLKHVLRIKGPVF
jgi:hypothetical protein